MLVMQYKTGAGNPPLIPLTGLTYDSKSFAFPSNSNVTELSFKPDGTKMYVFTNKWAGNFSGDGFYQYTLSTPWDVSTASYDSKTLNTNTQDAGGSVGVVGPDGYTAYMSGPNFTTIFQYALSSQWDVSTGVYGGTNYPTSYSGVGMFVREDGLKYYVLDQGIIREYNMGTPYNIDTSIVTGNSHTLTIPNATTAEGIQFNGVGTKMLVITSTGRTIYEYSLSTPWDITTLTYTGISLEVTQGSAPRSIWVGNNFTKLYVLFDFDDAVHQYSFAS